MIDAHAPATALAEPLDQPSAWFLDRVSDVALRGGDGRAVMVERAATSRGLMTPLHVRDEDEIYRVLDGTVSFFIGSEAVLVRAGEVVVVPAGRPRTLRVDSDGARWLILTRVSSPAAYEDFGRALARPEGQSTWTSEEETFLTAIGTPNAIRLLGPPGHLPAS
jgi:mannose-6-phosphate isomerase-like protein (cupin superfamily)